MGSNNSNGPGFIRGRKRSFTVVQDDDFVDGMSARAWGIYCYLVGRPAGWECRVYDLANRFAEGRDALYKAINELCDLGLLTKEPYYDGNLRRYRYRLDDPEVQPQTPSSAPETDSQEPEDQAPENPAPENPHPENPPVVSKEVTKKDSPTIDSDSATADADAAADASTHGNTATEDAAAAGGSTGGGLGLNPAERCPAEAIPVVAQAILDGYTEWVRAELGDQRIGNGRQPIALKKSYITTALTAGFTRNEVAAALAKTAKDSRTYMPTQQLWERALTRQDRGNVTPMRRPANAHHVQGETGAQNRRAAGDRLREGLGRVQRRVAEGGGAQ